MKKGFTLIELLAVIVILAIIALIVVPTITDVVERARKGAAVSSANGYTEAVEKQVVIYLMDSDDSNNMVDGIYDIPFDSKYNIKVKGQIPSDGWLEIKKGTVSRYSYVIGNYIVSYDALENTVVKGNQLSEKPNVENDESLAKGKKSKGAGGIKLEVAKEGATYKGIAYLDPTNLSNKCDESNSVSTTEVKIGCMKWYIFDDSGDNYTMILDHNTTARIAWVKSGKNVDYEESDVKTVVDDLVTTNEWVVTPRIITAFEINAITGKTGFDEKNLNHFYYFDNLKQSKPSYKAGESNKFDWLFNNVNKCIADYGCTIEDNNKYNYYNSTAKDYITGYWTSTVAGVFNSENRVWAVDRPGSLGRAQAKSLTYGIRPVISIEKALVD